MVTLAEIDSQSASSLVCDYMLCPACGFVARINTLEGQPCDSCGRACRTARLYFFPHVRVLVDLIQEAYHTYPTLAQDSRPDSSSVGVVLFFCTLREVLLEHFLVSLLRSKQVDETIIERLFQDNRLANQRFNNLFPAATGERWSAAVDAASVNSQVDYGPVSELMKRAADVRNNFLHDGRGWHATRDLATDCVNRLPQLMGLFVALHNVYVCTSRANGT